MFGLEKFVCPMLGTYVYTFLEIPEKLKKFQTPKSQKVLSKYPSENRKKSSKIFRSLTYLNIIFSFQKGQSMARTQEI